MYKIYKMINIEIENDFYIPKLCYELYEYDYNILEHGKNLKENEVMIWIPLSINLQFTENKLPNVLYILYTDIEIDNDNKLLSNMTFKENLLSLLKFIRSKNEFQKFYVSSYITYIENGSNNKINFLNCVNNKLNIPYRYINQNDYIFCNRDIIDKNEHMPFIKTNCMYIIDKNDNNNEVFRELQNIIIYEKNVYKKIENTHSCKYYCSIHELKNIITEKYLFSYNLSSYILNYLSILTYPIDPFIFEFENFYMDFINKTIYSKNDKDIDFFKKTNIKIIKDTNILNFNYFDKFTTKNFVKNFENDLYHTINKIFEHLYHNKKIILTGDIYQYNFIKRFLNKIFINNILIFIEDHNNIFYKKSNLEKSFSILYNKNTDFYDINLNLKNFKNSNLNLNKTLSLLLSSFIYENE